MLRPGSLALSFGILACSPSRSSEPPRSEPPPSEASGAETTVATASGTPNAAEQPDAKDPPDAAETPAVDPSLNQRYAEQTDVGHYVSQFEREGREVHDRRADIIAALELDPGTDIADVGAGTGLFALALARAVGDEGTVFAVDVQNYFLEHIEARAKKLGLGNVKTVRASQRQSGLEPDSVDVVFMSDAYHHIEYPQSYLADLSRALRAGGRLVVIDYIKDDDSPAWLEDHIRATPDGFRAEIERAGYRFERAESLLDDNFFFVFVAPPG